MRSFTVLMIFLSVFMFISCENSVTKPKDTTDKPDDQEIVDDSNDESDIADKDQVADEEPVNDESSNDGIIVSDEELIYPDEDDINDSSCYKNSDCGENFFCNKFDGLCNDEGECRQAPYACDEFYLPVCGCDGKTHSNFCFANMEKASVFYNMTCMNDLKTASMTFKYEKEGVTPEKMIGGVKFDFNGDIIELLMLSAPTKKDDGNIAHVSAVFNGINGVTVLFKFAFQREPFKLPQTFDLETSGQNSAEVKTDFGTTIGFLTGKLTVTKYEAELNGKFKYFEMNAPELSFAK